VGTGTVLEETGVRDERVPMGTPIRNSEAMSTERETTMKQARKGLTRVDPNRPLSEQIEPVDVEIPRLKAERRTLELRCLFVDERTRRDGTARVRYTFEGIGRARYYKGQRDVLLVGPRKRQRPIESGDVVEATATLWFLSTKTYKDENGEERQGHHFRIEHLEVFPGNVTREFRARMRDYKHSMKRATQNSVGNTSSGALCAWNEKHERSDWTVTQELSKKRKRAKERRKRRRRQEKSVELSEQRTKEIHDYLEARPKRGRIVG
jgi:hypothetical protein